MVGSTPSGVVLDRWQPFRVIIGNDTRGRYSSSRVLERMVMMERCILIMFIIRGFLASDPAFRPFLSSVP